MKSEYHGVLSPLGHLQPSLAGAVPFPQTVLILRENGFGGQGLQAGQGGKREQALCPDQSRRRAQTRRSVRSILPPVFLPEPGQARLGNHAGNDLTEAIRLPRGENKG